MSTIRIKRTSTSTTPTGLTFGEPAYVQGIKSLYIGQTGGDPAIRIGAEVSTDTTLASNSDNKIPTEKAVKTYVDNNVAGGAVASLNGITGAVTIGAGTAISIASAAKGITVTNTGVLSLTGTSNQITVSGSTGDITLSLPSTVTVPGALNVTTNLTVTGNLTVNGTTTTVNSDSLTIDDPIITLGLSGGVPISVSDGGKSRGIAMSYFDGAANGQTAFIGIQDQSNPIFSIYTKANINGEALGAGSTYGILQLNGLYLQRDANGSAVGRHVISSQSTTHAGNGRSAVFADHSGYVVMPSTLGTASYILKANGATAQPTWIDSNATGFTAFTSTNVVTTADAADTTTFLAFVNAGTDSNQGIRYNTGLTYNAATNSLSATTFVGALSGNATTATTATNATNVATLSDTADTTAFITFVPLASDTNQSVKYNSGLTYNAVTNSLSATTFVGALSGNATTATTLATARNIGITGDINGTATSFNGSADINISAQIAADTIVNADINSAAGIVDTKLATISTANKVSLTALDIDGGTVTTTIAGTDLLIVDNGANGTNRYVTVNNLFGSNSTATVDGGSY